MIFAMSCRECPTEPDVPDLSLTAPYVETSIVWLKISSSDSTTCKSFIVQRDALVVLESSFHGKDTLIVDKTVQPNTSYTYTLNYVNNRKIQDETESVTVTTLDISNRDFQWNVYYFGGCRLSAIEGVSIIDKDNIWAVGEIAVPDPDSSYNGTGCRLYNAVHWDGREWEPNEIKPPPFVYSSLSSVYAISDSFVWAGITSPVLLKNNIWSACTDFPSAGWMNDIWSNSIENSYFIFHTGIIVHYDGVSYQIMDNEQQLNLKIIDGNDEVVFTTGYSSSTEESRILRFSGNSWKTLFKSFNVNGDLESDDYGRFKSVRVLDGIAIINTSALAILKYFYRDNIIDYILKSATPLKNCSSVIHIDGNNFNDLCLFTVAGEIIHYNGVDFNICYDFGDTDCMFFYGDFKDDTICLVGEAHGYATIIVGQR